MANSCTWCNHWVKNPYISKNMALTCTLFQNNTEDKLQSKCLELHEEYTPIQQGGPLLAFLLLQHIQDSSEQALELLCNQVRALNISKLRERTSIRPLVSLSLPTACCSHLQLRHTHIFLQILLRWSFVSFRPPLSTCSMRSFIHKLLTSRCRPTYMGLNLVGPPLWL